MAGGWGLWAGWRRKGLRTFWAKAICCHFMTGCSSICVSVLWVCVCVCDLYPLLVIATESYALKFYPFTKCDRPPPFPPPPSLCGPVPINLPAHHCVLHIHTYTHTHTIEPITSVLITQPCGWMDVNARAFIKMPRKMVSIYEIRGNVNCRLLSSDFRHVQLDVNKVYPTQAVSDLHPNKNQTNNVH